MGGIYEMRTHASCQIFTQCEPKIPPCTAVPENDPQHARDFAHLSLGQSRASHLPISFHCRSAAVVSRFPAKSENLDLVRQP